MKKYLLLSVILFFSFNSFAQIEGNTKAKLYFQEAQKLFNQNDYKDALSYIAKTETTLGSTNGRILNLKIKTLYNMGKFIEAEKALSLFSKSFENDVTEEMKNDTYAYFVRIEKAATSQKERNIAQRKKQIESENVINSSKSYVKGEDGFKFIKMSISSDHRFILMEFIHLDKKTKIILRQDLRKIQETINYTSIHSGKKGLKIITTESLFEKRKTEFEKNYGDWSQMSNSKFYLWVSDSNFRTKLKNAIDFFIKKNK